MKEPLPVTIDSPAYSRFITKTNRTQTIIWTILFFTCTLVLLGAIELWKYSQTICGFFLLLTALIMLHLWLIFVYGYYYNSHPTLNALVIFAGALLLYLFLFTAFYFLHISVDKTNRVIYRNSTRIIWTAILCVILLFLIYSTSSNSRSKEVKAMDIARQEFFKKILILANVALVKAPLIPAPAEKKQD